MVQSVCGLPGEDGGGGLLIAVNGEKIREPGQGTEPELGEAPPEPERAREREGERKGQWLESRQLVAGTENSHVKHTVGGLGNYLMDYFVFL